MSERRFRNDLTHPDVMEGGRRVYLYLCSLPETEQCYRRQGKIDIYWKPEWGRELGVDAKLERWTSNFLVQRGRVVGTGNILFETCHENSSGETAGWGVDEALDLVAIVYPLCDGFEVMERSWPAIFLWRRPFQTLAERQDWKPISTRNFEGSRSWISHGKLVSLSTIKATAGLVFREVYLPPACNAEATA